jgi:ABC-type spermidine/putrescine transport system permease subunit I
MSETNNHHRESKGIYNQFVRTIGQLAQQYENLFPFVQLIPGLFWLLTFFGGAFGIVVVYSFLGQAPPADAVEFTVSNYAEFFADSFYFSILVDSFVIGVKVTVVTLVIAYPVAYYLAFTKSDRRNLMVLFIIIPFWINIVIRTYAWRLILGRNGVINYILVDLVGVLSRPGNFLFSQNAIVLGLVYVFLPFMLLPVFTSLNRFDRRQIEAAQNLGANKIQAFYEVTLPQSLSGVAGGVAIVFVLAFGSFVVPLLLGGPRNVMIANVIGEMFGRLQDWALGSAMAVTVTIISLLLVYTFNRVIGLDEVYGGGA